MMEQATQIYTLIIKVNKLFSFFFLFIRQRKLGDKKLVILFWINYIHVVFVTFNLGEALNSEVVVYSTSMQCT